MSVPEPTPAAPSRWWRWLRGLALCGTLAYGFGLAGLLAAISFIGERHALTNLGLFVPPLAWLLPLAVLSPLALCTRPLLLALHAGFVLLVVIPFMRLQWHEPLAGPADLVCITSNIAQSHGLSLAPFIRQQQADVVALQDSQIEGPRLRAELRDWQGAALDQFTLLSRHPITQKTLIRVPADPEPIAARFEVALPSGPVAIYDVRFPTPRQTLAAVQRWIGEVRRDPVEIGDLGPMRFYARTLPKRLEMLEQLRGVLAHETLPFVLLGDFNTPATGYVHRELRRDLVDCFEAAGRGYGCTFPGDLPRWVALYRPWLRLDHIYAGPGWEALSCAVEQGRRSEHRAVAARLRRTAPAPR